MDELTLRTIAREIAARLPHPELSGASASTSRFTGVALIADVIGFTEFSTALDTINGSRAADQLAGVINDLLGGAVDVVASLNGVVTDLVGDAVQAVWTDEEGGRETAIARAQDASRRIRQLTAQTPAGPLVFRVALGVGDIEAAAVGGVEQRWDTLIWGPAFEAAAAGRASPATQTVDAETPDAPLREPDGAGLLTPPEAAAAAASDAERVWSGELRVVSTLFCRLSAPGRGADIQRIHRDVRRVQEISNAFGGRLDKISIDKGATAVLVFSADNSDGETAQRRAIGAALGLRLALPQGSFGVATGKVFMGFVGGRTRAQHTLYGPAVNRAARLMSTAPPGAALCDEATFEAGGDVADFQPLEARLKGLGDIRAYGLAPPVEFDDLPPPVSVAAPGRALEEAAVTAFAKGDGGRVMTIIGALGLGRTSLARHAAAAAGARPVLQTATVGHAAADPLAAWRSRARVALRTWFGDRGADGADALLALSAACGVNRGLTPLAAPLFRVTLPETAETLSLSPQDRLIETRRLQSTLLLKLSGPGPLIIVDDADRIDEASLALAESLLQADEKAQLLLTARDDASRGVGAILSRWAGRAEALRLGPLDRSGVVDLVRTFTPVKPDHPLIDWLQDRCHGHPQLSHALLAALPRKILMSAAASPGAWRLLSPSLALDDVPPSIEATVRLRLARLTPAQQSTLRAASVAATRFDVSTLTALGLPLSPSAIADALQDLLSAGLLVQDGDRLSFPQDLVRATVYGGLPETLRRDLHARAAAALEAARRYDNAAELARHWAEAGRPRRALLWSRRAGRAAMASGAYGDAAAFFETALRLLDAPRPQARVARARQARLLSDRAAALALTNERDSAIACGVSALALLGVDVPKPGAAWTPFALANALRLCQALLGDRIARPRAADRYEAAVRIETANNLTDMYWFERGALAGAAMSLLSITAGERIGDLSGTARSYIFLAFAAGIIRLAPLSRWLFERPRAVFRRTRNAAELGVLAGGRFWLAVTLARWSDAERRAATINAGAVEKASPYGWRVHLGVTVIWRWAKGELQQARQVIDELHRLATRDGDDQHLTWAHAWRARDRLWTGDLDGADREFAEIRRIHLRAPDRKIRVILLAQSTMVRLRRREDEAAAEGAEALLEAAADPSAWQEGTPDALATAAEAMIVLHHRRPDDRSRQRARRALAFAEAYARFFPLGRAPFLLQAGGLAAIEGDWRAAARKWRAGLRAAQVLRTPLDEMRLADALAECPALPLEDRQRLRARAEELAGHTGLRPPPRLYGPNPGARSPAAVIAPRPPATSR